jgi:hypothetical protein
MTTMADLDLTDLKRRLAVHTNSARRIQAEPMFPIRADAVWELIAAAKERDELRARIVELEVALGMAIDDHFATWMAARAEVEGATMSCRLFDMDPGIIQARAAFASKIEVEK